MDIMLPSSGTFFGAISHAGGVYPTQDSSRMATVMVKQEQEADTRVIARE